MTISAQIHRFRDAVAVYIGTGETVYLRPADARKLSRAINRAAKSCESESFSQSTCGTASFSFEGPRE
jgi:hypothetical protein